MPRWIEKIDRAVEKIERLLAVGLYTFLIGLICVNILARNILHLASQGLLELAPTLVLWLALVGATLALKQQRHIKIGLLLRYFPVPARRVAASMTNLFAMGICAVLAYAGITFVQDEIALFGPRGWTAGCFALFFALAAFRFALGLMRSWVRTERLPP
jgi:TRAP-type C4-dicarboxylate transport system permease small subunit